MLELFPKSDRPIQVGRFVSNLFADPVPHLWLAIGGGRVPGDADDDSISVLPVDGVEVHPQG
jgi:hypothetical protein